MTLPIHTHTPVLSCSHIHTHTHTHTYTHTHTHTHTRKVLLTCAVHITNCLYNLRRQLKRGGFQGGQCSQVYGTCALYLEDTDGQEATDKVWAALATERQLQLFSISTAGRHSAHQTFSTANKLVLMWVCMHVHGHITYMYI